MGPMIQSLNSYDFRIYERRLLVLSLIFVVLCHLLFLFYKKIVVADSQLYAPLVASYSQAQTVVKIVAPVEKEIIKPEKTRTRPEQKKAVVKKNIAQKKPEVAKLDQTRKVALGVQNEMTRYKNGVRELINANRYYPRSAQRLGHTGRVVLSVVVAKNGQVLGAKIDEKSHFEGLNLAALKTIEKVGVFPPIPEALKIAKLDLEVPIVFSLD